MITSTWYLLFGSAEQYSRPTVLASGNSSWSIAACWSNGARSLVPDTLMPVAPVQSAMSRAVA